MNTQSSVMVTGGAGFIGSHLVDFLLEKGFHVIVYDNLSTGKLNFLKLATTQSERFKLIHADLLDQKKLSESLKNVEIVFHLAANADVRFGLEHPSRDLTQNTMATFYLLEAMREQGVKKIVFSSTGSVYGEANVIPTPEDAPFPIQTSLYAASKLACEALISAYAEGYGVKGYLFRFVSILGERYTHGHVVDFYKQLTEHPDRLSVLGNGQQKKSYLYVKDCIEAIWTALTHTNQKINLFNLGTDEYVTVNDSISAICEVMNVSPQITYSGGERGWVGDNPFIFLDCTRIKSLHWKATHTIRQSIQKTVHFLQSEG